MWATVIGLLKSWPVILGLLLYANEVWRHIFQILKKTTGHWHIGDFLPGVTAFRRWDRKVKRLLKISKDGILRSGKPILVSRNSIQSLANISLCAARIIYVRQTRIRVSDCALENRNPSFMNSFCVLSLLTNSFWVLGLSLLNILNILNILGQSKVYPVTFVYF